MRAFFVQIKCELGHSYDLLVKFYLDEMNDVGRHNLQGILEYRG